MSELSKLDRDHALTSLFAQVFISMATVRGLTLRDGWRERLAARSDEITPANESAILGALFESEVE